MGCERQRLREDVKQPSQHHFKAPNAHMSKDIASLPFWKGFHISRWSIQSKTLHLWLRRTDGIQTLCHHCLRPCNSIHDRVERRIRDLPILEYQVVLHVQLLRLACPDCGGVSEFLCARRSGYFP